MIRLGTLGSISVSAPEGSGAAAVLSQPKRFALLVYLAVAAPGGFVRRDVLLSLFWPDADQMHGRKVLRQTIYLLRRSLGSDAILSRGDEEVGVNADVVTTDVAAFQSALASRRNADAFDMYGGDFLHGFHVPDTAPELDQWIQSQMRRLRVLATNTAWLLANAGESAGNADDAAYWARRALALDPFNEKRVIDVMRLLARGGDRVAAVHIYEEYARHAKAELGIQPADALRASAAALRDGPPASTQLTAIRSSANGVHTRRLQSRAAQMLAWSLFGCV